MFFVIETFVRFFSVYRCCHMTHSRHVSTNPFAVQWSVGYLLGLCSDNCAQPAPELLPAAVLEEILQKLKIKPWNFPAKHSCCISWTTWDFYFSKHAPLYGHGLRSFEFFCNTFPEFFVDGRTLFDFPFVWEWATVRIFPFEWIVSIFINSTSPTAWDQSVVQVVSGHEAAGPWSLSCWTWGIL